MDHSSAGSLYIPYGRQAISESDIEAVVDVLRSPFLTQGPVVPEFEKSVSRFVNSSYGVAVNSATSALHIACKALELGPGDILWTSPNTFVASANCARFCGASVDFVDINLSTGLMDINILESKLKRAKSMNNLPKILVPVHFSGSSCDMRRISQLSKEYGFSVIEDASHAIGGKYLGDPVGSCKFSQICVFSFHPVKIITTGEGGMATTNDPKLAEKMRDYRSHGVIKDTTRFLDSDPSPWSYEQHELGFNYRMSDIQAALGLSQLVRVEDFVQRRNELYSSYKHLISNLPVSLLEIPKHVYSSVHLAVVVLPSCDPARHRSIFRFLRANNIGVQVHYTPVHLQPYYRKLGFNPGDFPIAEAYASSAVSLPLYPNLKKGEQELVAQLLNRFLDSV